MMNMIKRSFLGIAVLVCFVSFLGALDMQEGRIKLTLQENIGRFSAYYLENLGTNKYTPLFLDQDPRTTVLSIFSDNRVFRMGESTVFKQSVRQSDKNVDFVWKSNDLIVTESFSFLRSSSSTLAKGFKITVRIENISEKDLAIGVRYLFDTYLGESSEQHFKTDKGVFTGETLLKERSLGTYWLSPSKDKPDTLGFQCMTSGPGITVPDRVVFANWKRLNDSTWTFEVNEKRDFSQLPYSINDSAVAMYYDPVTVPRGGSREVVIVLGNYAKEGFVGSESKSSSEIIQIYKQTVNEPQTVAQDPVAADLIALRDFLAQLNKKLSNNEMLSDDEYSLMLKILQELEAKSSSYKK